MLKEKISKDKLAYLTKTSAFVKVMAIFFQEKTSHYQLRSKLVLPRRS